MYNKVHRKTVRKGGEANLSDMRHRTSILDLPSYWLSFFGYKLRFLIVPKWFTDLYIAHRYRTLRHLLSRATWSSHIWRCLANKHVLPELNQAWFLLWANPIDSWMMPIRAISSFLSHTGTPMQRPVTEWCWHSSFLSKHCRSQTAQIFTPTGDRRDRPHRWSDQDVYQLAAAPNDVE